MTDRLLEIATAVVDSAGNIAIEFPSVPAGSVWTGTMIVLTSAATTSWSATVGSAAGGIQWGAPWVGAVPYGPVQAYPNETVRVTAAGLTPGDTHRAQWIGSSDREQEATPVWPTALGTPQTVTVVGGGSLGLPANWSIADADTIAADGPVPADPSYRQFFFTAFGTDPAVQAVILELDNDGGTDINADNENMGRAHLTSGATGKATQMFLQRFGDRTLVTVGMFLTAASCWISIVEGTSPGATAGAVNLFARDNGAGKMQLCAQFPTGVPQVIATEP